MTTLDLIYFLLHFTSLLTLPLFSFFLSFFLCCYVLYCLSFFLLNFIPSNTFYFVFLAFIFPTHHRFYFFFLSFYSFLNISNLVFIFLSLHLALYFSLTTSNKHDKMMETMVAILKGCLWFIKMAANLMAGDLVWNRACRCSPPITL